MKKRVKVLFISELFPNPPRPAFGIFVERQAYHLLSHCDVVIVAPVRVFPHLRLWKYLLRPRLFFKEWQQWWKELSQIPLYGEVNGIPVFYPRYTSLPKQVFHGLWGFFAYPFVRRTLQALHSEHQFNLIHAHYAVPSGVIALLAHRWMNVPVVLSVHGMDITYTAKQNALSRAVVRWVFQNADVIIANSAKTARQIVHYGGNPEKVQIVHLGGDAPKGNVSFPRLQKSISLLTVGYLEKRKGHAYVLQAVRQLRDEGYHLRYVIVGDGPERESLERLTRALKIANSISFAGYKPHSEVWSYFADCDIFVLPSWNEAFGIVYIEALGMGKSVIGCAGEGGPEDLKALGDCIELVKPRDVESLVAALRRLIDNPERRRQMGEVGRQIVQERFTWQRNAADTLAIYYRVLGQKNV